MAQQDTTKEEQAKAAQATQEAQPAQAISDEELEKLCRERVCPSCPEMVKATDEKLRAIADAENVKKRLIREKDESVKFASEKVLADLLPVLDNLDLAITHGQNIPACKDMLLGVEMTRKVFLEILARHGLEPIGEAGEPFNPEWHEAVGLAQSDEHPENHVCQLVQKGYRLKGRLLRPAKVLINKPC